VTAVALFGRRGDEDRGGGRLKESGGDAVELVVEYVKQETIGPLKGVGRFLAFGIAGSLLLCVGTVLLLVGVLRLLQGETGGAFAGDWSWVPYLIVAVAALGVIALAGWRVVSGPAARRLPRRTGGAGEQAEPGEKGEKAEPVESTGKGDG
jgi:hypothetical protein